MDNWKKRLYNQLMIKKTIKKLGSMLKTGRKEKDTWAEKQIREMAKLKGKLILM